MTIEGVAWASVKSGVRRPGDGNCPHALLIREPASTEITQCYTSLSVRRERPRSTRKVEGTTGSSLRGRQKLLTADKFGSTHLLIARQRTSASETAMPPLRTVHPWPEHISLSTEPSSPTPNRLTAPSAIHRQSHLVLPVPTHAVRQIGGSLPRLAIDRSLASRRVALDRSDVLVRAFHRAVPKSY
jgi:hypothetical protein